MRQRDLPYICALAADRTKKDDDLYYFLWVTMLKFHVRFFFAELLRVRSKISCNLCWLKKICFRLLKWLVEEPEDHS